MANNTYIGARYVPIFADPVEWDNLRTYEPLTIVTYQGTSYTSKKAVPVGIALNNTEYWVVTGNYNAQVQTLQNTVNTLNETTIPAIQTDVNTLKNTTVPNIQTDVNTLKNTTVPNIQTDVSDLEDYIYSADVIFIGDSYGLDEAVGGDSWATLLETTYPDATFLIEGGTGFASDMYINKNWLSMLTAHVNTLTTAEKNNVKQIVVIGGANDANLINNGTSTETDVKNRIGSFCTYVKTNLPNAVIKCAFVGWYRLSDRHEAYLKARDVYANAYADNYAYYASGENVLKANDLIESVNNIHPTVLASKYLAAFISAMVNGGNFKMGRTVEVAHSAVSGANHTYDSLNHIYADYDGDTCNLFFLGNYDGNFFRIIFPTGTTMTHNDAFPVCNLNGSPVGGNNHADTVIVECPVFSDGSSYVGKVTLGFCVQYNQLICKVLERANFAWRTALIPRLTINMNLRNS